MNFIKDKWNGTRRSRKAAILLFVQLWFWPQVFNEHMPPNILLPLSVTVFVAFMLNLFDMIASIDKGE